MSETTEPTAPASASRGGWIRRALKVAGYVVFWLLLVIGAVLVGSALWIRRTFGPISVDQMLMNMSGGGEGAPAGYVTGLIWQAIIIPIAILVAVWLIVRISIKRIRQSRRSYDTGSVSTLPRGEKRLSIVRAVTRSVAALLVCATGIAIFGQTVNLGQYARSFMTDYSMSDYYVTPVIDPDGSALIGSVDATTGMKNLVVIILESGEESYSDETLFEVNMNEPLENVTSDWGRFEQLDTYEGGGWTMAGLVGTECGVPLRGPGRGTDDLVSNAIGAEVEEYLPGAVCLGDVLSGAGYTNVFMGGADASFSAKEKYLLTHGYDEVKDLRTWLGEGETDVSEWALSDHRLMENAKEEVTRLHDSEEPFHLTLLTVDSHEPLHQYDYCPSLADEPMESVIHCSMTQVAGFIEYMSDAGYLEDTAVLITGDHPKMIGEGMSIFADELLPLESRPLFNRLWDPEGAQIQRGTVDQLSMFATVLDVLHLGRDDHRAGVGVSAIVDPNDLTGEAREIVELSGEAYSELISSRSIDLYQELWAVENGEALVAGQQRVAERSIAQGN